MLRAVETYSRLIVIVGEPGSGKSLLLRELADRLHDCFDVLLIPQADVLSGSLQTLSNKRRRVVLIDEGWQLTGVALSELGRLEHCTVVLTGLTGQNAGDRLSEAGATVVILRPLDDGEVSTILTAWLSHAGLSKDLFDVPALARLTQQAHGQARRVSMLASAALDVAREHGQNSVRRYEVDQAACLLDRLAREPYSTPDTTWPEPASRAPCNIGLNGQPAIADVLTALDPPDPRADIGDPVADKDEADPSLARAAARKDPHGDFILGALCAALVVAVGGSWLMHDRRNATARLVAVTTPAGLPPSPMASAQVALLAPPPVETAPAVAEPPFAAVLAPPLVAPSPSLGLTKMPPLILETAPAAVSLADAPLPTGKTPALSTMAPVHVLVLFARDDAAAAARASRLKMLLAACGLVAETRPMRAVTGASATVRYFFAEDRDAADAVLAASGLPGRSLQASPGEAEPALRPGLIELVLPAGGVPAAGESRTRLVQTTSEGRVP